LLLLLFIIIKCLYFFVCPQRYRKWQQSLQLNRLSADHPPFTALALFQKFNDDPARRACFAISTAEYHPAKALRPPPRDGQPVRGFFLRRSTTRVVPPATGARALSVNSTIRYKICQCALYNIVRVCCTQIFRIVVYLYNN